MLQTQRKDNKKMIVRYCDGCKKDNVDTVLPSFGRPYLGWYGDTLEQVEIWDLCSACKDKLKLILGPSRKVSGPEPERGRR